MIDILIVGAGPAGMMSAIYARRADKNVLLLDKNPPGGRVRSTYQVDNYLGFGKVSAQELVEKMVNHLRDLGIEEENGVVKRIFSKDGIFTIITDQKTYFARSVIIASGTNPKPLHVENEDRFLAKGISYCAVCDGVFFAGEKVAVIGGGDSALEEAIYLSQVASEVTIIHDLDQFTATLGIVHRVQSNPKIQCKLSTEVLGFVGENELEAIRLKNRRTGAIELFAVSGAFIYAGNEADTLFLKDFSFLDQSGYIPLGPEMATGFPGLFACGDVTKKDYRFIVTAISDGAIAALSAVKYVDSFQKME